VFKKRKYIPLIFLILGLLIFPNIISFAGPHELNYLNINVFIDKDGNARITEYRKSNLSEGSENYIVINNADDSEIIDFEVEEDGIVYESIDNWDINASREEKAFKSGIINTDNGYELAWGIGEYGPHEFKLRYTITNFVKNFQETQGIFWEFISGTNIPPQDVNLTIESEISFNNSNSNIWAFGFEGNIDFNEDKIVTNNSTEFNSSDYLTVLVEFEETLFNSDSYVDIPFEEVKNRAFEGSDYRKGSSGGPFGFLSSFLPILIPIYFVFTAIFIRNVNNKSINRNIKLKRKFKEEYYRDYPYEGNFEDSFYILNKMGATSPEMLITAFILKWINIGLINIRKEKTGFLFKKEETSFKFLQDSIEGSTIESSLYNMMRKAAGSNEILESNEFSNWSRSHYKEFQDWEKMAYENSKEKMKSLGYLEIKTKKILFISTKNLELNEKGQEFEDNVYKFINYLHDFSIINERDAVNVKLWDNLMIWAGLLGLTEVVNKEFKKLYPEYETQSNYRGDGVYTAYIFANSATRAYAAAAARTSGGGGFSSTGGGGGSFGGGGGGTR
jgi:predicted membrane protein DUF2207